MLIGINDFLKIPEHPRFSINSSGEVREGDSVVNPKILLKGCRVKLGRSNQKISKLLKDVHKKGYDPSEISTILEGVDWLWPTRLLWKELPSFISVKVLHQAGGSMAYDIFTLRSSIDAQLIFADNSPFKNKWTRSYIRARPRISA